MLTQDVIESILHEACLNGADFAEVFDENTIFQDTVVSNEKIEESSLGRESGVGIRIFKGLKCYYGFTNEKKLDSLVNLVRHLTLNIKKNTKSEFIIPNLNIYNMPKKTILPSQLGLAQKISVVEPIIKSGMEYGREIIRMRVKLTDFEQHVQIANTEGVYVQDTRVKTRLYIAAYAQNKMSTQMSYVGPGAMKGHEYYKEINLSEYGIKAASDAKIILNSEPCPGGQMSVVVDNGFGGLLFHEACGHSLESTGIAKGASEFCGKLGTKIASDQVTLIDDGSIEGEWGSLHVDDEGNATRKNVLIENGILKSYMVDKLNGMRSGFEATGSARRQNYRFAPVSRMTNTYIAPGKNTPKEIIKKTEKGLFVKSINGGSVTPSTGDFNFSTGVCYLIENGEITKPVRGATLIGNGGTVLKNVDMIGNDFDLRQGFCYASSGALFIGAGQPTIRVSNMTVGGIE